MGKFSYTKVELELLLWKQLENLDALSEQVNLLKKQNELLIKMNHKLIEELSEEKKKVNPYPKQKRKGQY